MGPVAVDLSEGLRLAFEKETRDLLLERLRIPLMVGVLLYIAFLFLDFVVHPALWREFLALRGMIIVVSVLVYLGAKTPLGQRHAEALSSLWLLLSAWSISAMTVMLGGFASDYYIGNMLVMFFVGLFMPWRLRTTLTFSVLVSAGYFIPNLVVYGPSSTALTPTFFVLGMVAFTCFATNTDEGRRLRDLRLRVELEKANEDLKALDEAKMRFFSNVSHELRTPLMMISAPLDTLSQGGVRDPSPLYRAMKTNASRLLRHVEMLLDFARFDAGRLQPSFRQSDLGDLAHELVAAALPYAAHREIALELAFGSRNLGGRFDVKMIETVISNLLSNAIKFTPSAGRITVEYGSTIAGTVFLEVSDTGPGIPADHLDKIFERFHQVEGNLDEKVRGTGLGLALVKELVRLHGGDVTVSSEVGAGSTFRAEWQREPDERPERRRRSRRTEDRMAQAYLDGALADRFEQQSMKGVLLADLAIGGDEQHGLDVQGPFGDETSPPVLLVEDSPELRHVIGQALGSKYFVETAENGEQALEHIRNRPPQVIVSDVMMPVMNGYDLCRALKADQRLAKIPVILLTAKAGSDAVVEGLEAGADDYVIKPFDERELLARIAAHVRNRSMETSLREKESKLAAVGQMTASIAHDLRGPLQAIVGHTDLALYFASQQEPELPFTEDLEAVKGAAERSVRMIEDVVEFAREGVVGLALEPVRLVDYVSSIVESLRDHLAQGGVHVDCVPDGGANEEVLIDKERFRRVLDNIVLNARDVLMSSNTNDSRTVRVVVFNEEHESAVQISDSGPGIREELLPKLFQPFSTSKKAGGTGLGLVIAKNLVTAHGGTLRVDPNSDLGGAQFTIRLPRSGPAVPRQFPTGSATDAYLADLRRLRASEGPKAS